MTGLPVAVFLLIGIVLYFFARVTTDPPLVVGIVLDVIGMIPRPLRLLIIVCIGLPSILLPDRVVVVDKKQRAAQLEDSR